MSTQSKTTVLEMIAYRGTQLIDEQEKALKIFELTEELASDLFSHVYERASNTSKKSTILDFFSQTTTFDLLNNVDIKNHPLQPLVKILENKSKLSVDMQFTMFEGTPLMPLSNAEELNIWLNVIYAIFHTNQASISDALIKILRANHALKSTVDTVEDFKKILKSKPVLPQELFNEDFHYATWQSPISAAPSIQKSPITSADTKKLKAVQAETMAADLKKMLPKVENLQTTFEKQYKTAYDDAINSYVADTKHLVTEHQIQVKNALLNSSERLGDKIMKYTSDNPYLQPDSIQNIDLPRFAFNMQPSMNITYLKNTFTDHEIHLLLYSLDYDFSQVTQNSSEVSYSGADNLLSGFPDYTQWAKAVSDKIHDLNQQVIENTSVGQPFVKIGSFFMPVTEEINSQPLSFKLISKTNDFQENVSLNFNIPNLDDEIESIRFTRTINGEVFESQIMADKFKRTGNFLSVDRFDKIDRLPSTNATAYKIDFVLNDGSLFKISDAVLLPNRGIGGPISTEGSTKVNEDKLLEPYVPSGFGVKQLGVADYKKVVQTVKCYEEGEVSHIENIMAREYREKSSRSFRHKENTTTSSTSSQHEKIKDTASTSRYEMQSEVSKIAREDQNFAANVSGTYNSGGAVGSPSYSITAGASYATNNSQEESSHQAIQKAQELTERAVNRIVTNVLEERIQTVIEEYEETNRHGFDNREGENHVVGVYRWVDKLYSNQMVNYGKRMMFEFMVPEPARIHKLGTKNSTSIVMPEDPRTTKIQNMSSAGNLSETIASFWAAKYNVAITPLPAHEIFVGKSLIADLDPTREVRHINYGSFKEEIEIPEGYKTEKAKVIFSAIDDNDPREAKGVIINVGNKQLSDTSKLPLVRSTNSSVNSYSQIDSFVGIIPISATFANYFSGSISVSIKCKRTDEAYKQWQQETFNVIITAYEDALEKYNTKVAATNGEKDKTNPLFYRQIENIALRKNCISYLLNDKVMGGITLYEGNTADKYKVLMQENLDKYASLVKFLEQAFEWDIMSYTFYPYYWANRTQWNNLYQYNESDDALFRSFMQSGMARVVATVRPGFETAVAWFLQTGQIWNGSEAPVINDELFVSVIDEVLGAVATEEGEPWITRVPTTLTILQAQSIGLEVTSALPCDCDGEDCDSNFKLKEHTLGVPATPPEI
ncbi:hypothetical protein [Paenimyroides baculatum]|uniref:Uncharacterized protein n=1 Tax=Paenimyroides baculatum TaxID=2608000 RepID=A0A5M6CG13_9FLAO|nr:hypothetical protein [Paenimyroides baculatum]KAA5533893.1 hypothetical protein F0460_11200 [Paenimyroides baculatum]